MALQFSVFFFCYFATGIITLLLAAYSWKRRPVPGIWYFTLLMLAAAEWSITLALEMLVIDPSLKIFFGKWQYIGIVSCAPLLLMFVTGYTRNDRWTKSWLAALIWMIPVITLCLVATNELHGLVWPQITPSVTDGTFLLVYANGPVAIVSAAYSYLLIIIVCAILLLTLVQYSQIYRFQIWVLFLCTIIVVLADVADVTGINPLPGIDLPPLALGIAGVLIVLGVIRFRLLDLAPVVYYSMSSAMYVGVIAVDNGGRIIENNAAARQYLFLPEDAIGSRISEVVPAVATLLDAAGTALERQYEFSLGEREEKRWFEARISLLSDSIGQMYGKLVIFHDISTCKKVQEELEEAHNKLGILSSVTRHDILNNLAAMELYQDLCLERISDPATLGYIRKLKETSEMIRNHIEFMRYYEEIGGKSPAWYDLRTTVIGAAASHSFRQVSVELDGWDVDLYADPLIGKVFYNLIDNAVFHGGHVTRCTVTAYESAEGLIILFEDNGRGIPAGNKVRIFARGFGSRSGLGLFLIRRILSITGISIRETGMEGKGARFEIVVPEGKYRIRPDQTHGPDT